MSRPVPRRAGVGERAGSTNLGVSPVGVLLIVFVVLKLTGLIDWSWLWVLAPAWIGGGLALMFTLAALLLRRMS